MRWTLRMAETEVLIEHQDGSVTLSARQFKTVVGGVTDEAQKKDLTRWA